MALVSDMPRTAGQAQAGHAFATPTIVHFSTVLLLSSALSAPWHGMGAPSFLWGLLGLCGLAYALIVTRRLRSQTAYQPVFEDWLFHSILPVVAYALILAAALLVSPSVRTALFIAGAAAMLLLFVGIHNAWDTATYHVLVRRPASRKEKK